MTITIPWYDRAKRRMKKLNIERDELAAKLNCSKSAVNHYLIGRRTPELEVIEEIAKYLSVHPAWLLWGTRQQEPQDMVDDTLRTCTDIVCSVAEENNITLTIRQAVDIAVHIYHNFDESDLTDDRVLSLIKLVVR